jgi:hypothetical protein
VDYAPVARQQPTHPINKSLSVATKMPDYLSRATIEILKIENY